MPHLNLPSHGITDMYLQQYFFLVLWIGQLFKHAITSALLLNFIPSSDCVHVCMCDTRVCVYDVWYMCVHFCVRVDTLMPLPACGKQRAITGVSPCLLSETDICHYACQPE